MTQENTDTPARRRRDAVLSALCSGGWMFLYAMLLLGLRSLCAPGSALSTLLAVLAAVNLGLLIPLFCSLRQRLREIEGGEEDEAGKY